jgi:hypothetical protein
MERKTLQINKLGHVPETLMDLARFSIESNDSIEQKCSKSLCQRCFQR